MHVRDGYLIVRKWRIPIGELLVQAIRRQINGAQEATKQPYEHVLPLDWFAEIQEQPPERPSETYTTKPYLLGRYGFDRLEQAILLDQAGSQDRLLELIDYVEKAHRRLKMYELLKRKLEPTVQALIDAHEPAIEELTKILFDWNEKEDEEAWRIRRRRQSASDIRGEILKKIPGVIFPKTSSKAELEEWIAAAGNINAWLAEHGTFACCRRVVTEN